MADSQRCGRYSYEDYELTAQWLLSRTEHRPKVAIVCGSGLGDLATQLCDANVFHYRDIPNFLETTVPGHAGRLLFGLLSGEVCVCMQGRVHAYEGHSMEQITYPVRVFKLMGIETLILTNAAGGLNPDYKAGDIMLVRDHINLPGLMGLNPLVGPNDERLGVRFPCLSDTYDPALRRACSRVAAQLGVTELVHEGVLCMQTGPCYETVAESRLLRAFGADAVGMSTLPEAVCAYHCGLRVLALTLITNMAVCNYRSEERTNHAEVLHTSSMRAVALQTLVSAVVGQLGQFHRGGGGGGAAAAID
ncbi:purine nucleoside phosphorylase-like [Petromyzon marinus]|uniref:Purine nucleoside phosphorylase n=1 Tax=Petromyzon marinus TaxID=7757 RepID=A0AAJ7UFS6_PETMA|nr:purine nucleoside phosphorylase-like [Petromyzon marinus]